MKTKKCDTGWNFFHYIEEIVIGVWSTYAIWKPRGLGQTNFDNQQL